MVFKHFPEGHTPRQPWGKRQTWSDIQLDPSLIKKVVNLQTNLTWVILDFYWNNIAIWTYFAIHKRRQCWNSFKNSAFQPQSPRSVPGSAVSNVCLTFFSATVDSAFHPHEDTNRVPCLALGANQQWVSALSKRTKDYHPLNNTETVNKC